MIQYIDWVLEQHNEGCSMQDLVTGLFDIYDEKCKPRPTISDILHEIDRSEHIDYLNYGTNKMFVFIV